MPQNNTSKTEEATIVAEESSAETKTAEDSTPKVQLSDEQNEAVSEIVSWYKKFKDYKTCRKDSTKLSRPRPRQVMTLGGYAGVGKTTVIKELVRQVEDLGDYASVAAYTGKAVSVLADKNVEASTIHGLMYKYDPSTEEFSRRFSLDCDLVIIDEASMVDTEINEDLKMFGKPIVYVGDMFQLPPIRQDPGLMSNPDVRLETIHRQAGESNIIKFATVLRQRGYYTTSDSRDQTPGVYIIHEGSYEQHLEEVDQVICGFNKTKQRINRYMRSIKDYTEQIEVGDRLICQQNNYDQGVFNGMMGTVTGILRTELKTHKIELLADNGVELTLSIDRDTLGCLKFNRNNVRGNKDITYWDYGYAITCHKAQGSEWKRVLVIDEQVNSFEPLWDPWRWRYTAATRAQEELIFTTAQ